MAVFSAGSRPDRAPDPALWGLERRGGRLFLEGHDLAGLAAAHGTPLHVASARTLRARCAELHAAFRDYPRQVRLHFSYKTNPVAGVLQVIHGCGLGAEVAGAHELWLARRLGVPAQAVVLNGPNKSDAELGEAVSRGIGLIVVDGLAELERLEALAAAAGRSASIALRVCPDVAPRGMNASSLTGSRRAQFGLDLRSGEATAAIRRAAAMPHLRLRGAMAHIGSGIHDLRGFRTAADRLLGVHAEMVRAGAKPDLLDIGGGLGARSSREFTTLEMLTYLGFGRLPRARPPAPPDLTFRYGAAVCEAVERASRRLGLPLPELVLEPGRALVSDAQVLLLTVGAVRERPGFGIYALCDGGALSVSLMFLSEQHAVLLANREAPLARRPTSVFGQLSSPLDILYRNLALPTLLAGDVLAVMDAGAYFTATATNFGGPRPAVALVDGGAARIVRRRETSEDLVRGELGLDRPSGEEGGS